MTETDRLAFKSAVFVLLVNGEEVLLIRRINTGWMDEFYEPPAGHLEYGETLQEGALREIEEETGVKVKLHDLELKHIYQTDGIKNGPYIGFMFVARKWEGKAKIMEPEKCDDMQFFALDNLPDKITPYAKAALGALNKQGISYSYHDEESLTALNSAS
jgi:8-oxo-dGTP diphosphatase